VAVRTADGRVPRVLVVIVHRKDVRLRIEKGLLFC
jgi:hypothetical protein